MKFGKEFQHILDDSAFPDDWKTSAIEYRKLKKLIKNVVEELSSMGLSPDVLQKLLVTEGDVDSGHNTPLKSETDDTEVLEFEFESDEASPSHSLGGGGESSGIPGQPRPKEVLVDPILELDESTHDVPEAGSSSLPSSLQHRKFRLRLLSDSANLVASPSISPARPASVSDMLRTRSESYRLTRTRDVYADQSKDKRVMKRAVSEHGGVKAEYVIVGDNDHPVPQIRLHVSHLSASSTPILGNSPCVTNAELLSDTEAEDEEDDDEESTALDATSTASTMADDVLPPSPALKMLRSVASPIWAIASGGNIRDGMHDLSLDETAPANPRRTIGPALLGDQPEIIEPQQSSPSQREFIIPLQSDVAFFNVLTAALTSLSAFHAAQQVAFRESVAALCTMISQSIQPGDSVTILPTPLTPTPASAHIIRHQSSSSGPSQKDLYAWREIFGLWIEAQIFESTAERDRGERSVDAAEKRLKQFANEVVKRGLGDRRTLRGKKTRRAWEEFLRLNVLLLDLKRFQMANIDAARKILKKHDKRTALTASSGFSSFVRSTFEHIDKDGNVSTWTFYNTSLPHVLLASLTDTLLPILPSLDDYACLICMSIAFKPIRLTCGHLFCVRCLVKMQRRNKQNCPLCRSPTVLLADKSCLDITLMNFMKGWFPKEVKEKQKENTTEAALEQLQDAGLDPRCCIM